MNNIRTILIALSMTIVASSASAAHPFYLSMLERGVASASRGDDRTALQELQTAAFGLLEDLPQYEMAQVHIALVSQRLGNDGLMRAAAAKVAQAEQLEPSYRRLPLAPQVRQSFNALAPSILSTEQLALLLPTVDGSASQVVTNSAAVAPPRAAPAVVETVVDVAPPVADRSDVANAAPAAKELPVAAPQPSTRVASPKRATATDTRVRNNAAPVDRFAERLRAAAALLDRRDMAAARRAYAVLLVQDGLTRAHLLQIGRGLNRAGAWQESAYAYQRALPLQVGEEIHMFHEATNRYELGEVNVARSLMARAADALPNTPEIAAFRAKIGVN